jgi:hypothetical protein
MSQHAAQQLTSIAPFTPRVATWALITLIAFAALGWAGSAAAGTLRCNGKLVQVGDPKVRLLTECGQPLSKDVVAVIRAYDDGEQIRASYAEDWSYETKGVEGHQILRFEAGRLVGEGMRCSGKLVLEGDTTVTVLQRCGEPVTRDAAGLLHESPGPASRSVISDSPIEQWTYSQGKGSLLKIILLRGGRIEQIEDGPRQ